MYFKRFFTDITKYRRYLIYATKATLKTEVSDSYLAWFWWILEPFCFMLIYTFIAGVVFKTPIENAPIFVFAGLTIWNFFSKNVSGSVKLLKSNKGIITRIYLPKYMLYIKMMMVNAFKMAISFGLCAILMICYKVSISHYILCVIPCLIMLTLITFGIGCIFLHIGVYVGDLSKIVNIGLRLLFYMSGVFYDVATRVPAPYGALMLYINPVALAMSGFRNALLYKSTPNWITLGIWSIVGLVLSIIGIHIVYKNENNYGKIL